LVAKFASSFPVKTGYKSAKVFHSQLEGISLSSFADHFFLPPDLASFVLRGFALLGIALVNEVAYFGKGPLYSQYLYRY
jgi:hypothetical protein